MLAAELKPDFAKAAKERQGTRTDIQENLPECSKGQARDQAAAALGVSGKTVDFGAKVLANGDASLIEAVKSGAVAVSAAAKLASPASRPPA